MAVSHPGCIGNINYLQFKSKQPPASCPFKKDAGIEVPVGAGELEGVPVAFGGG